MMFLTKMFVSIKRLMEEWCEYKKILSLLPTVNRCVPMPIVKETWDRVKGRSNGYLNRYLHLHDSIDTSSISEEYMLILKIICAHYYSRNESIISTDLEDSILIERMYSQCIARMEYRRPINEDSCSITRLLRRRNMFPDLVLRADLFHIEGKLKVIDNYAMKNYHP